MSIAASVDGQSSSEDEDSAKLHPSGVAAAAESDPELTAVLSRAAARSGLEACTPPSPEPSRWDDWLLGTGCGSRPRPAPVPFFPEVHEELMKWWTAPFYGQKRLVCLLHPRYPRWQGGYGVRRHFPRWRVRLQCTCACRTPPLGGIVLVSRPKPVGYGRSRGQGLQCCGPSRLCAACQGYPACTPSQGIKCTRVVPTRGWSRNCAQRLASPYGREKSQRSPSGRRCPQVWSKSTINGSALLRGAMSTKWASSTLSSPRRDSSATLSRTVPSSSRQYRSRPRQHILPRRDAPLRRRARPSLLVAVGALLCPPELGNR